MHPKEAIGALCDYWTCDEDGRGSWKMVSYRDSQIINEALSTLTALASQEGAQAGEVDGLPGPRPWHYEPDGWYVEDATGRRLFDRAYLGDHEARDFVAWINRTAPPDPSAQAGEVVKQWRHELPRTYLEWSGWYDGEPPQPLLQFSRIRYRTVYATPPAPDEAVQFEPDWEAVAFNLCSEFGAEFVEDKHEFAKAVVREYLRSLRRATPVKGGAS